MDPTQQETGSSLMVIGWLMMLFAMIIAFFHPSAGGIGRTTIDVVTIALVAGGIGCNAVGFRIRSKAH